jgi:prevent-host-death family protein
MYGLYKMYMPYISGRCPVTRVSASQARHDFAETVNRVAYGGDRILLHRRGRDLAALVPIEDLQLLEELERNADLAAARAALKEAGRKGTVPWEKLKAELGL